MYILGLSYNYHDSAASLFYKDKILGAVKEENFSRKKHDFSFPKNSINWLLRSNSINLEDIDIIVYYENGVEKFLRQLKNFFLNFFNFSKFSFFGLKMSLETTIFDQSDIAEDFIESGLLDRILFNEFKKKIYIGHHHLSHASAAFFLSPFEDALVICIDGVGEFDTTTVWLGAGKTLKLIKKINYPHSFGLFYSAFTYYCGFKVNSGEYKLMGLAPYGQPIYKEQIMKCIKSYGNGEFELNMKYFDFDKSSIMISKNFLNLFKEKPRTPDADITQFYMNIACSVQEVLQDLIINFCVYFKDLTNSNNLCLSGGVALNCSINGKLAEKNFFKDIWVYPAAGDAGSSIGAALSFYYLKEKSSIRKINFPDSMNGTFLGPWYSNSDILTFLKSKEIKYSYYQDEILFKLTADFLNEGKIIGWFSGKIEFGPRALGSRSIIADPRDKNMQKNLNLKIKFRESFRPFAPSILEEEAQNYFNNCLKSEYMTFVYSIKNKFRIKKKEGIFFQTISDKINELRSIFPCITHLDYSSRVHTVNKDLNPRYYKLIKSFYDKTGCPMVCNTSFNVRGEPIVLSPQDAYECFMSNEMDVLILENYVILKKEQINRNYDFNKKNKFILD